MNQKNNFKIKKATISNLKDILRLNIDLFKKGYKEYDKSLNLKWTYSNEGKKYFKDRIIKNDGFVEIAINSKTNKIIGYLCGGLSKRKTYRKDTEYAELENMIIDKKFRSSGLGGMLVKDFINWCKKNKVKYVSVVACAQNIKGIKFYRRMGFKDYNLTLERILK